jgi:hypothetical protein
VLDCLALIPAVIGDLMKEHVFDSWNIGFLIVFFYVATVTPLAVILAIDVLHGCEKAGGGEKAVGLPGFRSWALSGLGSTARSDYVR